MGKAIDEILNKVYYDLDSSAAYAGVDKIFKEAKKLNSKIKLKDVQNYLEKQRTYTLHKPIRKRFPRLKTIPDGWQTDWQCDLCILDNIRKHNDDFPYLLVCIDVLTRKIWVAPSKSKKSQDMINAFEIIFNKSKYKPDKLYSDAGLEFEAEKVREYFSKNGIFKITARTPDIHAGVVERANRTIKTRLYKYFSEKNTLRWINIIDKIINGINNSVNRTLGMSPNQVTRENAHELYERLYKKPKTFKKSKFKLGDIVRITKFKGAFEKGYLPNFTDELFEISQANKSHPPTYRIKDLEGNIIQGIFYEPELVKTTKDTTYRIAEIIKTRIRKGSKEHFVRWVGFSNKYNSWVKDSDLVN